MEHTTEAGGRALGPALPLTRDHRGGRSGHGQPSHAGSFEGSEPPVRYIVGVRMRRQKEVSLTVLGHRGRWFESVPERQGPKDPAPLKVKEVWVEARRYVVCLTEEERRKDAHDRAAIVAHLREQLRQGDKSLVGNKGYRRYLKVEGQGHFQIDEAQIKAEAR